MSNEERFIELAMSVYERHKDVILIPYEAVFGFKSISPVNGPMFGNPKKFAYLFACRCNGIEVYYENVYDKGEIGRLESYLMKDNEFAEMMSLDIDTNYIDNKLFSKKEREDVFNKRRIGNLVDKDNLNSLEDAIDLYMKENKYGDEWVIKIIKSDMIDDSKIVDQLISKLGETREIKGKPVDGYKYGSLTDLEDDIYNTGYLERVGEINPLAIIYRYFVKDKERFMDRINKYSIVYPRTTILSPGKTKNNKSANEKKKKHNE